MYIKRVEEGHAMNGLETVDPLSHFNCHKTLFKMQLTPIGSNQTEVETADARILFSYRTPVAAYVFGEGYVKTSTWYSSTTSRHINKWGARDAKEVDQKFLDNLA